MYIFLACSVDWEGRVEGSSVSKRFYLINNFFVQFVRSWFSHSLLTTAKSPFCDVIMVVLEILVSCKEYAFQSRTGTYLSHIHFMGNSCIKKGKLNISLGFWDEVRLIHLQVCSRYVCILFLSHAHKGVCGTVYVYNSNWTCVASQNGNTAPTWNSMGD